MHLVSNDTEVCSYVLDGSIQGNPIKKHCHEINDVCGGVKDPLFVLVKQRPRPAL